MDMLSRLCGPEAMADAPPAPASTLVIFGAAGDLTRRLLMPSLYNLHRAGLLDERFQVVGVDHNERDDEGYRALLTDAVGELMTDKGAEAGGGGFDAEAWSWVRERLHYLTGDFTDPATYERLVA